MLRTRSCLTVGLRYLSLQTVTKTERLSKHAGPSKEVAALQSLRELMQQEWQQTVPSRTAITRKKEPVEEEKRSLPFTRFDHKKRNKNAGRHRAPVAIKGKGFQKWLKSRPLIDNMSAKEYAKWEEWVIQLPIRLTYLFRLNTLEKSLDVQVPSFCLSCLHSWC